MGRLPRPAWRRGPFFLAFKRPIFAESRGIRPFIALLSRDGAFRSPAPIAETAAAMRGGFLAVSDFSYKQLRI